MQATGAVMASGQDITITAVMRGIHIYMGGVSHNKHAVGGEKKN